MTQRTKYTTPVDNAGVFAISNSDLFEGEELEPDWEWAKDHYAKALRTEMLAMYAAQGIDPPDYLTLNRICAEAAEARLLEVQDDHSL